MFRNKPLVAFDQSSAPRPLLRTAQIAAGGVGFVAAHRYAMRNFPGFAEKAHNLFTQIEERSPGRILRTFGLSELYSSYLPQAIEVTRGDLFIGADFSAMGEHLQRMLGTHLDLRTVTEAKPLRFIKNESGSAFMKLEGAEHIRARFYQSGKLYGKPVPGRLTGSSQRLGAALKRAPFSWTDPSTLRVFKPKDSIKSLGRYRWGKQLLKNIGAAQRPEAIYKEVVAESFQPGAVQVGKAFRDVGSATERLSFLMGERAQTLMSDIRLGLWEGSYNSLFHVPFKGGAKRGLINQLLTKRALPVYAAAIGLGFADYLTHHVVSNTGIDAYQQTRVFHAKLTDKIPGARRVTDKYEQIVPGSQYGPLALPLVGATAGALYHYSKVVSGKLVEPARAISARVIANTTIPGELTFLKIFNKRSPIAKGLVIGFAAMIPFLPGMLGSRKTGRELQDIYSGKEPVAVRSGRWWDLGTTPWEGNRIKAYRPHWSILHRTQAEKVSLYGSEKEYWAHHPILHPLRWLKDPNWLERKHYADRPYPITSPAFSDVPLVGPLLASTIGKLVKPPVRMHPEWSDTDYNIGSSRLAPRGPEALPAATPKPEFGLKDTVKREFLQASELIGLPGFIARTLFGNAYQSPNSPDNGKDVYFQGSRMMESISRRYYEKELGAGLGPNPDLSNTLGYSEPLRRFIQPEPNRIRVNEIPNTMPSWLPGEDYFMNFKVGDPYAKISEGYARLPGEGYEALHPEVAGMNPEDYPSIVKMSILGDIAPYSTEFKRVSSDVRYKSENDIATRIEYEKISARVKAMKDSVVRTEDRQFSKEVTKSTGTVSRISRDGIELSEFPGRVFNMSSVGYSASDQSAMVLGEHNNWSSSQVADEVGMRQQRLSNFFDNYLQPGTKVGITTPLGALESQEQISAVFDTDNGNVNKALIDEGLGQYRKDLGGPEAQAMFGWFGRAAGRISEDVSFTGDEARWNPLRYVPTPYHSKLWQERTPLAQYQEQEVEGARLRRWQHPIEDFLMPYARGTYRRVVGDLGVPGITQKKWDLNTMADMLEYVRDMKLASADPALHGRYTNQASRTAIGSNLFGQPTFIASTFSGRDATYFQRFLKESDPNERHKILSSVPAEMAKALSAQWTTHTANIARAEGEQIPELGEGGRPYTKEGLEEYSKADTKLNYGEYQRSKEVADFFTSRGLNLPEEASSPLYNPAIDYEDVKLKIIQQEGYDAHDFGLFDDRSALLWRKPYVDGAVRELTGSDNKSVEQIRRSVEEMILAAHDKNPQVVLTSNQANKSRGNVRIDVGLDQQQKLLQDMRRNPEKY